jgi:hypothetical protein
MSENATVNLGIHPDGNTETQTHIYPSAPPQCLTMENPGSFSDALMAVRNGNAIQRVGWNGVGLKVKLQTPDENSKMNLPYLYIEYPEDHKSYPGAKCPWLASQTDILAYD